MKDYITLKTIKEIKIISNPIRMNVIKNYYLYGKAATVKQMAVYMNQVPANIHYHVKKLVEINVLVLDHTEMINGITAKFYIPTAKIIKIEDSNSLEGGYLGEKEIIISNIFDENKLDFIQYMRKKKKDENIGSIRTSRLSLTHLEYLDLEKLINDYVEENMIENQTENINEDKKEYLFFNAVIEIRK